MEFTEKESYTVEDLRHIVALLRGAGGCSWDRVQTHESLRRCLLEESYETVEAIEQGDPAHLREELGDLLLQVVFHAGIEEDAGRFDLDGVADGTCRKLLYRHPHVFGAAPDAGVDGLPDAWEALKRAARPDPSVAGAMASVSRALPALWRAEKLQRKAEKAGYPLPDQTETARRIREADADGTPESVGQLLFWAVRRAALAGVDPEEALGRVCDAFIRTFREYEGSVQP